MKSEVRVVVCGSSVYMAALAANLQTSPDVAVSSIPANATALAQTVAELAPSVVAFDLGEMPGELAVSLLRDRPGLIVVGVDPSSDRLLVLSGRQELAVSVDDLFLAITGAA